jgi:excisionase family DNA binding protein
MKDFEPKEYLTAGEVARLLHVSPKTISRWAALELIPCLVTLGGHRRFHRADVEVIARRMKGELDER